MIRDPEIAVVNAAKKALELYSKDRYLEIEEAIKIIMKSLKADENSKVIAISAVNSVIKMKRKSPGTSDKQIIQKFLDENQDILKRDEDEEFD